MEKEQRDRIDINGEFKEGKVRDDNPLEAADNSKKAEGLEYTEEKDNTEKSEGSANVDAEESADKAEDLKSTESIEKAENSEKEVGSAEKAVSCDNTDKVENTEKALYADYAYEEDESPEVESLVIEEVEGSEKVVNLDYTENMKDSERVESPLNVEKEQNATEAENPDNVKDIVRAEDNPIADKEIHVTADKDDGKTKKIITRLKEGWNSYLHISENSLLLPVLFIIGTIIYLEVILHLLIYRSLDSKIIYPVLFAIPLGLILSFIAGLFRPIVNKIILWSFTALVCIVFSVQLVYYYVFKVYFSFQTLGMAGDAVAEFGSDVLKAIKANLGGLILMFLPLILLAIVFHSLINYTRRGLKEQTLILGGCALFQIVAMVSLLLFGKGDYSPYDLYFNSKVQDLCGKQLGVITMTRMDLGRLLDNDEELILTDLVTVSSETIIIPTDIPTPLPSPIPSPAKQEEQEETTNASITPTPTPTPIPIDTSPNIMDIDFLALADAEKDKTIKKLHNYFATVTPTNKNEYTGMFKGYNLIMITAEGFSPYAIHEEKTPTLYKLVREGFVFNNFYTALWQTSTSDGEYVAMTGMIPIGTRSMYNGRDNLWPFSMGHQFNELGVASKAYHNHTYTYYQRDKTHPNLGYIYKGKGNGLELENPDVWPGSDLEMINSTVDEYINEEQFHVYYMTVSGHMNYTFVGNSMSYKNKELVADLPYSSDVKAYIACQIELDRALEQLIKRLEEAGVADKTVIALSADHYPYGWEKEKLDEIAGHEVDPNFEIFRNHFILWNAGMKEPIVVDEPCSSMDIIPTLSNLFGLEYDSRLLMGQDIFSDAPPLVFLSNRSFITDKVMYNSTTGEVIKLTDEELPDDYVKNINKIIKNKFTVSETILKKDYYRYVFPERVE